MEAGVQLLLMACTVVLWAAGLGVGFWSDRPSAPYIASGLLFASAVPFFIGLATL